MISVQLISGDVSTSLGVCLVKNSHRANICCVKNRDVASTRFDRCEEVYAA